MRTDWRDEYIEHQAGKIGTGSFEAILCINGNPWSGTAGMVQ